MNLLKSLIVDSNRILNRSALSLIINPICSRIGLTNFKCKQNLSTLGYENQVLTSSSSSESVVLNQIRTYKTKTRLRKRCKSCYFVWRNGRLYVECEVEPRHKQFHKASMIKGFDKIPFGYDMKAERAQKAKQI